MLKLTVNVLKTTFQVKRTLDKSCNVIKVMFVLFLYTSLWFDALDMVTFMSNI